MKKVISPGFAKKTINLIDNIVYSHQKDLKGNPMELKMSIMVQNGNSEMRLAAGKMILRRITAPSQLCYGFPAAAGEAQTRT